MEFKFEQNTNPLELERTGRRKIHPNLNLTTQEEERGETHMHH